jgi:negative regulator of genetic competence, sporulation and motility
MTSVGKVPLEKTFSYIGKNQRQKLEDFLNFNDVQKVYFFAKDTLPRGSHIETSFNELYLYDDYFHLTRKVLDKNYYKISIDCNQNILYSRGGIGLCVKD